MDSSRHWTPENLDLVIEACLQPDYPVVTLPASSSQPPQVRESSTQRHNSNKIHPSGLRSPSSLFSSFNNDFNFSIPGIGEMKNGRDTFGSSFDVPTSFGSPTFEFPSTPPMTNNNHEQQDRAIDDSKLAFGDADQVFADPTVFDHHFIVQPQPSSNNLANGDADQVMRYLIILNHASNCFERRCSMKECHKMRAFIGHVNRCSNANNGCKLCRRFFVLSRIHAAKCEKPIGHCPVLFCGHFKLEKLS